MVEAWQPKTADDPWPVIIVDQANELMSWQRDRPRDVSNLLNFLIQISKQKQQCHVVLASSEPGFMDWLSQGRLRGGTACGMYTLCDALLAGACLWVWRTGRLCFHRIWYASAQGACSDGDHSSRGTSPPALQP